MLRVGSKKVAYDEVERACLCVLMDLHREQGLLHLKEQAGAGLSSLSSTTSKLKGNMM